MTKRLQGQLEETNEKKKKGVARKIAGALVWLILILLLLVVVLFALLNSERFVASVVYPQIERQTGVAISAATTRFAPLRSVELSAVTISDRGHWSLKAQRLSLEYRLWRLLVGELVIDAAAVEGGELWLNPAMWQEGQGTADEPPSDGSELDVTVGDVQVSNSRVLIGATPDQKVWEAAFRQIQLHVPQFEFQSPFQMKASAEVAVEGPGGGAGISFSPATVAIQARTNSDLSEVSGDITLELKDVTGSYGPYVASGETISVSARAKTGDDAKGLHIETIELTAMTPAGETMFVGSGNAVLTAEKVRAECTVKKLDSPLLRRFPGAVPTGLSVSGSGSVEADYARDRESGTIRSDFSFSELGLPWYQRDPQSLSGSAAHVALQLGPEELQIESATAEVLLDGKPNSQLEVTGTIDRNADPIKAELQVRSTRLDVDSVLALAGVGNADADEPAPEELVTSDDGQEAASTADWVVAAEADLEQVTYRSLPASSVRGRFSLRPSRIDIFETHIEGGVGAVSGSGLVNWSPGEEEFSVDLDGRDVPVAPVYELVQSVEVGALTGTADSIGVRLKGTSFQADLLKQSLTGRVDAQFSDLRLPWRVHELPPFNLLFLPVQVVSRIGSFFGNAVLPDELTSLSKGAADTLREDARLYVKKWKLTLDIGDERVKIEESNLNTDVLPTVFYEGSIGFDSTVDLLLRLKLLGAKVPLPVTGTLERPLPDVVTFLPTLVERLGLGVVGAIANPLQFLESAMGGDEEPDEAPQSQE
ncbi:MAG: hypothetical protein KDD44_03275 [Bdellovibrionales bacterium]|nr:hypothetical protein [Bdellovibrionales bacterium]